MIILIRKWFHLLSQMYISCQYMNNTFAQNVKPHCRNGRANFSRIAALSPNIAAKSSYLLRIKTHNGGCSQWMCVNIYNATPSINGRAAFWRRDAQLFANRSVRFIRRPWFMDWYCARLLFAAKGGRTTMVRHSSLRCSSAVHTSAPVVGHKYATRSNILLAGEKMGCARTSMLIRGRTDAGLLNFSKRLFITVTGYFPVIRPAPNFRKYG